MNTAEISKKLDKAEADLRKTRKALKSKAPSEFKDYEKAFENYKKLMKLIGKTKVLFLKDCLRRI